MRAVVQRVSGASVTVEKKIIGRCKKGLVLLVGVHRDDTTANAAKLADRIANLRIFGDEEGKMNLSLIQIGESASVLAASNFTVYGDAAKNRRPSFTDSAGYEVANGLFDDFVRELRGLGVRVEIGEFGAHMEVALVNDGPVTIVLDV